MKRVPDAQRDLLIQRAGDALSSSSHHVSAAAAVVLVQLLTLVGFPTVLTR